MMETKRERVVELVGQVERLNLEIAEVEAEAKAMAAERDLLSSELDRLIGSGPAPKKRLRGRESREPDRALKILAAAEDEGMRAKDLAAAMGMKPSANVSARDLASKMLARLYRDRLVERPEKGLYRVRKEAK